MGDSGHRETFATLKVEGGSTDIDCTSGGTSVTASVSTEKRLPVLRQNTKPCPLRLLSSSKTVTVYAGPSESRVEPEEDTMTANIVKLKTWRSKKRNAPNPIPLVGSNQHFPQGEIARAQDVSTLNNSSQCLPSLTTRPFQPEESVRTPPMSVTPPLHRGQKISSYEDLYNPSFSDEDAASGSSCRSPDEDIFICEHRN